MATSNSEITIKLSDSFNSSDCKGNYSTTLNNMKLVHWPLMDGLLHLVQQGWTWSGQQSGQAHPRCTKCNSPPINGQCTSHRIAGPLLCGRGSLIMWPSFQVSEFSVTLKTIIYQIYVERIYLRQRSSRRLSE